MTSSDRPVYFARDIIPGDILIAFYDHPKNKILWSYLVLKVLKWDDLSPDGRKFIVWDSISETKHEYHWDNTPLIFDKILKFKP